MLVRVFVDASPHIPEHRQLPLFTHLISTVGSTQFLHTAVILLLEKHVAQGPTTPDEKQVSFNICLLYMLICPKLKLQTTNQVKLTLFKCALSQMAVLKSLA